jgi:hypothetical protein
MAVNFNLLRQTGPANFYEGFTQGQEEQRTNALTQQKMAQEQDMNALRRQQAELQMQQTRGTIQDQESARRSQAVAQKTGMFRDRLLRAPTPEAARELVKMQYADPDVGGMLSQFGSLDQALAEVPSDPAQFEQYRQQEAMGMSEWMKSQQLKTVGNRVFNPRTMSYIEPPAQPKEITPPAMVAEYKFAQTPEGGGFRGSYQEFVIAREAAKRAPPAPRPDRAPRTQQTTLSDGSLGLVNMDTGVVTPITMAGAQVKGKPSAFAEKATAQRAQMGKDLDFAIRELGSITKDGGLIDQSTGSGAGRLADLGARFVGQATAGDVAIGKIAPVADLALKMVPRFEGPQSDKDTASYKEAAGQLADATLPTKIRKEAGRTVLRLMKERKGQFATGDMAAESAAPALDVRSQADAILRGGN